MIRHLFVCLAMCAQAVAGGAAIEIDLSTQKALLVVDGETLASAPISSGRAGYATPSGEFKVLSKERDHFSSLYGRIVNARGLVLRADATPYDPLPRGGRFVAAPMKYFIGFAPGYGLHAGTLPGHPASHGCVRLPRAQAQLFFEKVQIGDAVRIVGRAPRLPASAGPPTRR